MGHNLQTFKDIRFYLGKELTGIYPGSEIKAITNIIIRSVTGISKGHQLYLTDQEVTGEQASIITRICLELKTGKPIQYILGETIFYECRIKLNSSTLIPRAETEELVDLVIRENIGYNGNIIDFATGSGCIAIAVASILPGAAVTGTDISDDALTVARENARINNVRIIWLKDDILTPDTGTLGNAGIIVSNPPYVRNSEKQMMNKNVLDFEPHIALFVEDSDPLVYYRGILNKAVDILDPGGRIYFEINEMLGEAMSLLLESYGYSDIKIITDLSGKERIIKGIKYAL
jgi:release factor glutamine methyltransferase